MEHPYNVLAPTDLVWSFVCVRFYPRYRPAGDTRPKGVTIHQNIGHSVAGVLSVDIDPKTGNLRLVTDMPDGGAIACPIQTPDSSLGDIGAHFGPTGGNKLTGWRVTMGAPTEPYGRKWLDLRIGAHYDKLVDGEYSNVWLALLHDVSGVATSPSDA